MSIEKYFERHQYLAGIQPVLPFFFFFLFKSYCVFYQSSLINLGLESKAFLGSLPFTP